MPSRDLPIHPSLEQYRKQAKELLKACRSGDSEALKRIREHSGLFSHKSAAVSVRSFKLSDAQFVIAREHGFENWRKFSDHIQSVTATDRSAEGSVDAVDLDIATEEIYACSFSADSTKLLTGAQGNPILLWDVKTGKRLRTFAGHTDMVYALSWRSDQLQFVSGAFDRTIRMWDANTGRCLKVIEGHEGYVRSIDVSADWKVLLSGSGDRTIRLWDLERGNCIRLMEGHADAVYSVALSLDGSRALSGSRDGTVRIWDLTTGQCVRVLIGHTYHVHCVLWDQDQSRVLSSGSDVRVWDLETGRCLRVLNKHSKVIRSILPGRGHAIVSASYDRTLRLWDTLTGECLRLLEGHGAGVVNATWSADQRRMISCDWSGEVRTWGIRAAEIS